MNIKRSFLTLSFLLLAVTALCAQETLFFSGFEYEEDEVTIFEPDEMNGAIDQVGEWVGDPFPPGQGDILVFGEDAIDTAGIIPSPYGGTMLLVDRPTGDPERPNAEDNSDFTGSYFAELADPTGLPGTAVSFIVGTRRTNGSNNNKDYDIIGRDEDGEASFHLRVSTNGTQEKLGYVDANGDFILDFPDAIGTDQADDIVNTGAFTIDTGPGLNDRIGSVSVLLGADGYVVDFGYPEGSTANIDGRGYTTAVVPYSGTATELARVEFTYEASTANGRNSGYVLDEVLVTGIGEVTAGDFNSDDSVDLEDFMILANNFGTGDSFFQGDNNFDGKVDLQDFVEFKAALQAAAAQPVTVPEPSSGLLVIAGFAIALAGRRRSVR